MSNDKKPDVDRLVDAVTVSTWSMVRIGAGAGLVLGLVLLGVAIGTNFAPHVANVEQRIIEPVRRAAAGRSTGSDYKDVVDTNCSALVSIRVAAANGSEAAAKPASAHARKHAKAVKPDPLVGVLVTSDGFIATAAAGVPAGALEAVLSDGSVLPADLAATNPLAGIALLKVDGDDEDAVRFAEDLEGVGQTGIALTPAPRNGCSASQVFVSADFLGEAPGPRAFIRLQAPPSPDLAGVPVFDPQGRIIGMTLRSAKSNPAKTSDLLPGNTAGGVISRMLRDQQAPANRFGFEADDIGPVLARRLGSDRERGSVISLVKSGSSGDKAGLVAGDIVVAVDGVPISSASEVARAEDGATDRLTLLIQRGDAIVPIELTASSGD